MHPRKVSWKSMSEYQNVRQCITLKEIFLTYLTLSKSTNTWIDNINLLFIQKLKTFVKSRHI